MIILFDHSETVSVRGNQSLSSYPFSVSSILSYANSRGYNSVFFDPYYQDTSSAGWLMRFINLELIDGNLYLCDYNPNEWYRWTGGYSSLVNPYISHYICANSATQLGDQISPTTGFGTTTYLGRSYYYYSVNPLTTEPMFATTLQYTKIFVNNEDVTPATYNWVSVSSISGKNGISYALSTLTDINDGDPITTSDTTKFSLSPTTNVDTLVQNALNDG